VAILTLWLSAPQAMKPGNQIHHPACIVGDAFRFELLVFEPVAHGPRLGVVQAEPPAGSRILGGHQSVLGDRQAVRDDERSPGQRQRMLGREGKLFDLIAAVHANRPLLLLWLAPAPALLRG